MASGSTKVNKLPLMRQGIGQTLFAVALPLLGRKTSSYQYVRPSSYNKPIAHHSYRAKSFQAMHLALFTSAVAKNHL